MVGKQNWWQLSSVVIGGLLCLPVIMIGQTLSQIYGFSTAIISILAGNAILLLLGIFTAKMSCERRKTTMENAIVYFGQTGVVFFSLSMIFVCLGWFAIQLNVMSIAVVDLLSIQSSKPAWTRVFDVGLGLAIIMTAVRGIKALNLLANLSLPLLVGTLGYGLFSVERSTIVSVEPSLSWGGVSVIIAMAITMIIDLPTYFRHAVSQRDGLISIVLIFAVALPIMEIAGVYLASGVSEGTILDVLKMNHGYIWNIWIAVFLVLAGWTTNNLNLYSASVSLGVVAKSSSMEARTWMIGCFGTLLACFDVLSHLVSVLNTIGVLISSMGAVIITRYILEQLSGIPVTARDQSKHLIAWAMGLLFGFCGMNGLSLTNISGLDAMIGAALGTLSTLYKEVPFYEKINIR